MARIQDLSGSENSSTSEDEEYLDGFRILYRLGDHLGYVVEKEMKKLHADIMERVRRETDASNDTVCHECSIANMLPCPYPGICKIIGGICSVHKSPTEMCRPCPSRICDKIRENIEHMHVVGKPNWRFTRAENWCTDHNELIKCYMPDHLARDLSPSSMDISALTIVIKNNTELKRAISASNICVDRLRDMRNGIMHSRGITRLEKTELLGMVQRLKQFMKKYSNSEELVHSHIPTARNNLFGEQVFTGKNGRSHRNSYIPFRHINWTRRHCDSSPPNGITIYIIAAFLLIANELQHFISTYLEGPFSRELLACSCILMGIGVTSILTMLYLRKPINKMHRAATRWCRRGISGLTLRKVFRTNAVERNNSREKDLEEKINRIVEAGQLKLRVESAETMADCFRDFNNEAIALHTALSTQAFAENANHVENIKRMNDAGQLELRLTAAETIGETVHEFKKEALAHHMELIKQTPAHECALDDAKHELRRRLARFYHGVKVSPFISQKTKFGLSEFYVRSRMHVMNTIQWGSNDGHDRNEVIKYEDLLHLNNSQARHIFLLGDSGKGKSIVSLKLAVDWCHRYFNCSEHTEQESQESALFSDGDLLQTFEYLFYIDLKGDTRSCEIDDIIKERLITKLYSFHEREDACKLVEDVLNSERCIVIADSTEEWKHPMNYTCHCTDRSLPFSVDRPLCTFVFTMRPWLFFQNCSVDAGKDIVVKVSGVSDANQLISNIFAILQRSLPSQRECSSREIQRYFTGRRMESLLSNPMYLVYLVCLWHEEENFALFNSRCKVFFQLIRLNLSHQNTCSQSPEIAEVFPQFLNCSIDQTALECLLSVAQLAFERNSAAQRKEIGSKLVNELLHPQILEQALDAGILSLVQKHSFTTCQPETIYYFTNPTIQDFLTVLFMFTKHGNIDEHLEPDQMSFLGRTTIYDYAHIFIFSCAMLPEYANVLSKEFNESLTKTSKTKSGYDAYEFEVAKPASKSILYLQDLFVAGFEEAQANGVDTDRLKFNLTHFIFGHLNQSDGACRILREILLLNEENIASLDVTGLEEIIADGDIADVISKSKRSITSLRLVKRFGMLDISQCTNLQSLCICFNDTNRVGPILHDRNTNFGPGLERIRSCSLHNVSPRTQEKIFNSMKTGMQLQLENFIICKCHDVELLCEALQKMSDLKYLYVEDVRFTNICLPINACITRITFHDVTLTEDVLENLLKRLTLEPEYVECCLNITKCSVLERLRTEDDSYLPQRKRRKFKKTLHVKVLDTEMEESMDEWLHHFAEMLKKRMACQLEMSNVKRPDRVAII